MKTIYYNPSSPADINAPFLFEAYVVNTNPDDWSVEAIAGEERFDIATNSYCAIVGWKVFETLFADLPIEMSGDKAFEHGEETSLPPKALLEAAKRLRNFADNIAAKEPEKDILWKATAEEEYRIITDIEEVKATLLSLAAFLEATARKKGMYAEFWV